MPEIDWGQILRYLLQMFGAYLLALPIAWDREQHARSAGLRTYPLVSVGACGFLLVGFSFLPDPAGNARLMQGLIGGLGFLGGGAILKSEGGVVGMATAASIWNTGAIGMAVAYHRYEIAIVLSVMNFFTFRAGASLKRAAEQVQEDSEESEGGEKRD